MSFAISFGDRNGVRTIVLPTKPEEQGMGWDDQDYSKLVILVKPGSDEKIVYSVDRATAGMPEFSGISIEEALRAHPELFQPRPFLSVLLNAYLGQSDPFLAMEEVLTNQILMIQKLEQIIARL